MKNIVLISFVIAFISCEQKNEAVKEDRIVNVVIDEEASIHEKFDTVEFLKFEIPDTVVVSQISDFYILNDFYVLVERIYTNSNIILVFDKDNNFKFAIDNVGSGPNEYQKIYSLTVDSVNNHIYVHDNSLRRIHQFDLTTGSDKAVKTLLYDFDISEICYFNNALYYFSSPSGGNHEQTAGFAKTDMDGNVTILRKKSFSPEISTRGRQHFFSTASKLYFLPAYQNSIFSVDKKGAFETAFELVNPELFPDSTTFDFSWRNAKTVENLKAARTIYTEKREKYFYEVSKFHVSSDYLFYSSVRFKRMYLGIKTSDDNELQMSASTNNDINHGLVGTLVNTNSKHFVQFLPFPFVGGEEDVQRWLDEDFLKDKKMAEYMKNTDTQLIIRRYRNPKKPQNN